MFRIKRAIPAALGNALLCMFYGSHCAADTTPPYMLIPSYEYVSTQRQQVSFDGTTAAPGYRFVLDTPEAGLDIGRFVLPNGTWSSSVNQTFPTLPALEASYPAGVYTLNIAHQSEPSGPIQIVTLNQEFHPEHSSFPTVPDNVPVIVNESWENGHLIGHYRDFVLRAENLFSANFAQLTLTGGGTVYKTQTPTFPNGISTLTFPLDGSAGFTLTPFATYEGVLSIVSLTSSNGKTLVDPNGDRNDLLFSSGYGVSVQFSLYAIPEPSTIGIGLSGAAILVVLKKVRHYGSRTPNPNSNRGSSALSLC